MSNRQTINTENAPQAIGTYSQAVKAGTTVYVSGQIPLIPETMELEQGDFKAQTRRCFENLKAIAEAAGGELQDAAKVGIFLTDLSNFNAVNEVMAEYFTQPYPARAAIGVKELPKGVPVEIDAILELR
ncbi:RidA family protein [Endozoicomonas sp. 8E]|uniref:RidA family protein n=1 Tax=unclassified Endozoicomonas TaxID=2644528 RepID=UPI002938ECDB|nr:RidA family protein [Endozoicomonas sp. 8E]WOG28169.1 RidA family protein [Endozoicomonas sp. 8E]